LTKLWEERTWENEEIDFLNGYQKTENPCKSVLELVTGVQIPSRPPQFVVMRRHDQRTTIEECQQPESIEAFVR